MLKRHARLAVLFLLLCGSVLRSEEQRREIRFPDIPGYRTLKCDLHLHTVFSDGFVWPTIRVHEAWRQGLDAISITDHIEYRPHKQDVSMDGNRPHELATNIAKQKKIQVLLIKGAEITKQTPPGHFNAIFMKDVNVLNDKDLYAQFDQVAAQKAFAFWNHPGWQGPERGRWGPEQTRLYERGLLKGIEVCNHGAYYADAHRIALEKNMTIVGNSDEHYPIPDAPQTPDDHRTMTLIFARERNLESIREALDKDRTAVWYKNLIIGKEKNLQPFFAACVQMHKIADLADNKVSVEIQNRSELILELKRAGDCGPETINIAPDGTGKAEIHKADLGKLTYNAMNFLVGPKQPMTVKLELVSAPPTATSAPSKR